MLRSLQQTQKKVRGNCVVTLEIAKQLDLVPGHYICGHCRSEAIKRVTGTLLNYIKLLIIYFN